MYTFFPSFLVLSQIKKCFFDFKYIDRYLILINFIRPFILLKIDVWLVSMKNPNLIEKV